ncbi:MAG TPA: carboxypeptidase regulatory-like domain-containing protein [Acidobacteriaceae bacterium]|nr:carboxypeptidase regulatory-like domain-containing protein [Acidobacteriaceae bacterium]
MQRLTSRSAGAVCLLLGACSFAAAQTASPAATDSTTGTQGTQNPTPAASGLGSGQVPTGATRVHGAIADPDGAAIPGATVTFTPTKGSAIKVTSGADGNYTASLVPGSYTLLVSMPGFSSYLVQNLKIAPVASMTVDAKLQVGQQEVVVNVDANAITLSVDPDANASSTVIQGKDLEALSDDPDELSNELTALAGPAAGPNGGQIYVDGFTGGQLPPKSSIREIRINQNPFSAEYDRIGYGRVEVFTKPGTDTYHGNFQVNGNPSQFNSPNPLSGANQPPYHTIFMFGSLTGPINKSSSFSVGGSHRDIEDNAFSDPTLASLPGSPGVLCPPGTPGCQANTLPTGFFTHYPQVRTDISPRFDFALGEKNVLTARFQYVQNDTLNAGLGNFTLPSAAYNSTSRTEELQLSDTQTFSSKLINETRFEWERDRTADFPLNSGPLINVQGTLTAGGASVQNTSDHQDHFEVQNYTSVALKKNFIRFGGRLRTTREAQYAAGNTNASFTYAYLQYTPPAPGVCPANPNPNDQVCNDFSYLTGRPTEFTYSKLNNTDINYNYADLGLYAEDDWKPLTNLTLSYGLRYETQNFLPGDHHDFAPRLSFAYGLGSSKGPPKTVVRGGFGIFYDRFGTNYILNTVRYNGTSETLLSDQNPSSACSPNNLNECKTEASVGGSSTYIESTGQFAPTLRSPYLVEFAGGFDQQLSRHGTLSVNYIHSQGVHELAEQNIACPTDFNVATSTCNNNVVTNEYFSEGYFKQDQLFFNGRVQTAKWLSIFGFYGLNFAKGDSSGAGSTLTVPYDIKADFGRTTFDTRQRLFLGGSVTLPWFIQFSPFAIAQSGNPYNVTLGTDPLQDSYFNERPYAVPLSMANGTTVKAIPSCGLAFVDGNANPNLAAGYSTAPINACTGPNLFTFNFRLTKAIGFGAKTAPSGGNGGGQGGRSGPPGSGGGRGGRGGGPGGPGGFGGTSTGRRYSVAFGVNVQNLFNNTDLANPISNLSSTLFGQSINLAQGPYTQQSAVRRLSLQASFNF